MIKREPLTFKEKIISWLLIFYMFWMIFLFLFLDLMISFIVTLILVITLIILVKYRNRIFPSFITIKKIQWIIEDASPIDLEKIIANMYGRIGYRVLEVTSPSNDFGADIILKRKKIKYVVQVKKYTESNKISREDIQKLQGAKEHYRANGMKFVTTGFYTLQALDYAHGHRIETIDGDELINLMCRSYKKGNKIYNKILENIIFN